MADNTTREIILAILLPLGIFFGIAIVGYSILWLVFRRLQRLGRRSSSQYIQVAIDYARVPVFIWVLLLATYLTLIFSDSPQYVVDISGKILLVLAILSVTSVVANTIKALIKLQARRAKTTSQVTSLMQNLTGVMVYILGILLILYSLHIQITPILATLGIGSLAVALALQGTLADLISGFYISASKQIKIGDYIKLESGEEGNVVDITWRATQINMHNNLILVPNEKLSKLIITNYHLPVKDLLVLVDVGVHYNSDLRKVEQVTLDVAREVLKEVAETSEWEPYMRYHTFSDFSINFTIYLKARGVFDSYKLRHEFIKRLHERYKAEGIVIPFPVMAINYGQELASEAETREDRKKEEI